ncbi:M-phase phosphoprotein 8 [Podochytrium sp. JEL0797]|nr:M-phase phosphoprotein 8 [Podochytrium sp. JEL0797]
MSDRNASVGNGGLPSRGRGRGRGDGGRGRGGSHRGGGGGGSRGNWRGGGGGGGRGSRSSGVGAGDWDCGVCNATGNFASRSECFRCHAPRFGGSGGSGGGRSRGGSAQGGIGTGHVAAPSPHSNADLARFAASLGKTETKQLGNVIARTEALWKLCWRDTKQLSWSNLRILLTTLARLPPSTDTRPPPIGEIVAAFGVFFDARNRSTNPEEILKDVELAMDAVDIQIFFLCHSLTRIAFSQRLLKFLWHDRKEVQDGLQTILSVASPCLSLRDHEHRKVALKINNTLELLEKPWTIKVANISVLETPLGESALAVTPQPMSHFAWRAATVGWLGNTSLFNPYELPKMHTAGGRGNGTYATPEEYFDVTFKLMVAITFEEGNSTLSPLCKNRDKASECGKPLRPCGSFQPSSGLQCMVQGCQYRVILSCSDNRHSRGLCASHAEQAKSLLLSGPSQHASTHIYDCLVTKITFDGKIYFEDVASRRPPLKEIHWRTSKRLQSPNLVGLVKVSSKGSRLYNEQSIVWAEIVDHSRDSREDNFRRQGLLAVSILQLTDVFSNIGQQDGPFHAGDYVAVIDCQTFVPENIPVLKALEIQRETSPLPFQNGALLNISARNEFSIAAVPVIEEVIDAGVVQPEVSALLAQDIVVSRRTRIAVEGLVAESLLDPIIQIRRSPNNRALLERHLMELVEEATLDEGQFESFLAALKFPVHCTQGPPGTGKSYLGVVIARALLIVRDIWIKTCPSKSAPPLLVLSYKNHAIDEFLCDLVAAAPKTSLIRIGAIKDERLRRFSENSFAQENYEVKLAKRALEKLHDLKMDLDQFHASKISFGCIKDVLFAPPSSDPDSEKTRRLASYDAATKLVETLAWLGHFASVLPTISSDATDIDAAGVLSGSEGWIFDSTKLLPLLESVTNKKTLAISAIQSLFNGIRHYNDNMDSAELLWNFLCGFTPRPPCAYPGSCTDISESGSSFCSEHQCTGLNGALRCQRAVLPGKGFCERHACLEADCSFERIPPSPTGAVQVYCDVHACRICVSMGFVGELGNADPPRNTCDKHPLCLAVSKDSHQPCDSLAETGAPFCAEHALRYCSANNSRGGLCRQLAVSRDVPFCTNHLPRSQRKPAAAPTSLAATMPSQKCRSLTGRGKPCKGNTLPGSLYCPDHVKNPKLPAAADQKWEVYEPVFAQAPQSAVAAAAEPSSSEAAVDAAPASVESIAAPLLDAEPFVLEEEFFDAVGEDAQREDPDEMDVTDRIQHLRDIYGSDGGDEFLEEEAALEVAMDSVAAGGEKSGTKITYTSANLWSWSMSVDERWEVCQSAIDLVGIVKAGLDKMLMQEVDKKRKEYHHADIRARSKVYEGKSVIGGTIVGCISRLDAIRITNPFAVVVEEASEVLEPLLFSCLGATTCKLEMIGDHYQLQPSMMNKFEFERVNKMNVSLFERLILAPKDCRVPQSVLSIQRRMRPNIADLTRDFYADITVISDHTKCVERRIGDDVVMARGQVNAITNTESRGWHVPGVSSNIFFWSHSGNEERASVGLSKVNRAEAKMVCDLARYLVTCGVPKTSIAIITPYKGQLMEIRKMLEKPPYNLCAFKDANSIVISTVDRFQGDESDIVIASLVIDNKSTSPFVKQLNRMIVLNSRARIGFFIVGNPAYFDRHPVQHWKTTIDHLIQPAPLIVSGRESDEALYDGPRFGPELPICCPQHRIETKLVSASAHLRLGFCTVVCTEKLPCSHECGMKCHFPVVAHQSQCRALVPSPCQRHPQNIECFDLFKSANVLLKLGVEFALQKFKCGTVVELQLPCTHVMNVPCAKEKEISSGVSQFPVCSKPSLTSFVHSECMHEVNGACSVIAGYLKDSQTAPNCSQKVEFVPVCGHSVSVKCYLKRSYESGSSAFVCPTRVTVQLPRCLHQIEVSCQQAIQLRSYAGTGVAQVGRVLEGADYGPKDANCQQSVEFVRLCGHVMPMKCEKAFAMASSHSQCAMVETDVSPFCGHEIKTTCSEKRALALRTVGVSIPPPISVLTEGDLSAFGTVRANHRCAEKIRLIRKCGHEESIECCRAEAVPSPCKVLISIDSPLCGHPISAPCGEQNFGGIWSDAVRESDDFKSLLGSVMPDTMPKPSLDALPANVRSALLSCKHGVQILRKSSCGHTVSYACKDAFKMLLSPSRFKNIRSCTAVTIVTLECGHSESVKCLNAKNLMRCKQMVVQNCWNVGSCGKTVEVVCGSGEVPRCESVTSWVCSKGHSLPLAVCFYGHPSECPACSAECLENALELASARVSQAVDPFVVENFSQATTSAYTNSVETAAFSDRKEQLLNSFKSWTEDLPLWDRPLFSAQSIEGFLLLRVEKKPPPSFSLATHVSPQTLNGVMLRRWTPGNVQKLMDSLKEGQSCTVLLVSGFAVNILNQPADIPKLVRGKDFALNQWLHKQIALKHHDAMQISLNGWESVVFWTPFCVRSSGYLRLSKSDLDQALQRRRFSVDQPAALKPVTFKFPLANDSIALSSFPSDHSEVSSALAESLNGTLASGCSVAQSWDGLSIGLKGSLMQSVEKELRAKLGFIQKARGLPVSSPFAGINYLHTLRETLQTAELRLVLAMELHDVGSREDAEDELEQYVDAVGNLEAHPLLALAVSRIATKKKAIQVTLLRAFAAASPFSVEWLTVHEKSLLADSAATAAPRNVVSIPTTPRDLWEALKHKHGCASQAMEDLLELVGLKKVKMEAIELFKSAIGLQQMPPDVRKKNMVSMNYSFYGNPGTGKTTVAKLFAQILKDSNMRPSGTFIHTSARKLKDDGADKFMELVQMATNGVLFIDEAYALSPVDDPKGREIVNELLVVAEDFRDKISIIIAGYEDDMEIKLFAFNEGLKSRFQGVVFEDFDEADLLKIWAKEVADRGWTADERIGALAVKKLAKLANRKGFGNARAVRNKVEEYCKRAMASDSWDGGMMLNLVDIMGENPSDNPKLKAVLREFDERIGWVQVKKSVKELVAVSQKNYEREMEGLEASPVVLNRLFLGNPGTGKTTCASLYAKLLKHLNFLSKGEVITATASDFVGSHVGESQKKTNALLEKARGSVLLIDEAYSLDDCLYGKQVLDVLVEKVQGSENDDIAVLMCGYDEPMLSMLRTQNPGLARRFPRDYAFEFADYTDSELLELFNFECTKKKVTVASYEVKRKAIEVLSKQRNLPNFGNAGAVDLLIRSAISKASMRQTANHSLCLEVDDFVTTDPEQSKKDPLDLLNSLYRIDAVKNSLIELRNAFSVALREGGEAPSVSNFVFTGSPGTGKTTVARVMAEILYNMGILSTNRLVETSGLGLTGEYVGHTKKRVEKQLGEARGGVLFIDEAYELGKGHFSDEALTSLVAAMTNPLYKGTVIIIAGYSSDIDGMLDANVGLKSRFTRFFHFEDWNPRDCLQFFEDRAEANNYAIDEDVAEQFLEGMNTLIGLPGWGNGRDVTKLWESVLVKRSSRVVASPEKLQKTIALADVRLALDDMIAPRRVSKPPKRESRVERNLAHLFSTAELPPPPTLPMHNFEFQNDEMVSLKTRISEIEEKEEVDEQEVEETDVLSIEEILNPDFGPGTRDPGVSDEAWAELEVSKQNRREELERQRRELEEKDIRKLEKARRAVQEKIRKLCPCPMGYQWSQVGGGWRCGGGSHFVSDAQLQKNFMI